MSYRILATTDLSTNSKTGLRFAIQLASQKGAEIIFFHIADISRPAPWSDKKYPDYEKTEIEKKTARLKKFVEKIYEEAGMSPGPGEYVVQPGERVDELIIEFARENSIDLICMGTRGAGLFRRFIGTHTSSVLSDANLTGEEPYPRYCMLLILTIWPTSWTRSEKSFTLWIPGFWSTTTP
jgi:nucleotide-binding universal stress UspA family protein